MSKKDKNKQAVAEEEVQTQDRNASVNDLNKTEKDVEPLDSMEQFQKDLEAEKDRYLRLFAEFENYKKR
ncbi:MAG: nucleotide exchange factor GrpE, partial [Altibacter sp.]|nr:nucleotide exchange factor GrpE [Altibacter sp.]